MKNFLTFSRVILIVLTAVGYGTLKAQNYGVKIDYAEFYGDKAQLRFDDLLLGEHVNGQIYNPETDARVRSFTLSAWFKSDADNPFKLTGQILGYGMADYYGMLGSLSADFNFGTLQLSAKVWKSQNTYWDRTPIQVPFTYEQNKWYFFTLVADDKAKEVRLYVDGELKATLDTGKNNSGKEMSGTALLSDKSVFYFDNGANGNLSASYDELQLWNKVLTPEEIKTSMSGYTEAPENLVGYYTLDNPSQVNIYPNEGYGAIECPATVVSTYTYGYTDYAGGYGKEIALKDCKTEGCDKINKVSSYPVTIGYEGEGTILLTDDTGTEYPSGSNFEKGTTLTVKAVPSEHYRIDSIRVNETNLDLANPQFTVDGETDVTVFFGWMKTRIAADEGTMTAGGKYKCIDPESNQEYERLSDETGGYYFIPYGEKVKIVVDTNEHYVLTGMRISNDQGEEIILPEDNPIFTVSSPGYTIELTFSNLYTVTYHASGNGKLDVRITEDGNDRVIANPEQVIAGTKLTVTPVPDENCEIKLLTVNGSEVNLTDGKYVTTVDRDTEIKALFKTKETLWTITYTVSGSGSLQVVIAGGDEITSGEQVTEGTQLIFTPLPEEESEFGELRINGISVNLTDGNYTTTAEEDLFAEVFFKGSGISATYTSHNSYYNDREETLYVDTNADRVIICKTNGEFMFTGQGDSINVAKLPAGNYVVYIETGNRRSTFKFVKK